MEGKGFAPFLLFYKIVNDLITIYIHNRRLAYISKLDFLVKKVLFGKRPSCRLGWLALASQRSQKRVPYRHGSLSSLKQLRKISSVGEVTAPEQGPRGNPPTHPVTAAAGPEERQGPVSFGGWAFGLTSCVLLT